MATPPGYKPQKYDRHSTTDVEPILEHIRSAKKLLIKQMITKRTVRVIVNKQPVKVTSLRLQTFAFKGLVCSKCGITGSFFAIERMLAAANGDSLYHLNLYAVDANGHDVLMTHDHTLARGLGGKDHIDNCTTMCSPCNFEKGLEEGELARERKL